LVGLLDVPGLVLSSFGGPFALRSIVATREGEMLDPELSDEIVAAAQAGDGEAFRVIYLSLGSAVLGYLRGKGAADPEATTNDVFLALLPKLPGVRNGAQGLRRLIFTIAHARLVDEMRQRERRPRVVEFDPQGHSPIAESAESTALGANIDPHLIESLRQLPADQREVLLLRTVADLNVEDVAAIMRRSQGAVRQLQHRAVLALRALLAERRVTK
jgi:RNA polymerase sigma-70 factor (ECF subfamily)